MTIKRIISLVLLVALVGGALWLKPAGAGRNLIFTGGPIVTGVRGAAEPEAVWVQNGRIVAIGALAEIQAISGGADTIDLAGNTLMPGLIEPHTHPLATATLGAAIDVSGFTNKSRAEVIESLKAGIAGGGNGGWIVAFGWDPVMLADLTAPTLEELDALSPDKPMIILTQMMHDAYANSLALEAAGITASSPNPQGGIFVKDADGKLTGTVREVSAIDVLMGSLPPPPVGAHALLLDNQFKKYAEAGYTTIAVLGAVGGGDDPVGVMKQVAASGTAAVRTLIYGLPTQIAADATPESRAGTAPVIGVKYWMDGSPFAGGAAFKDPYVSSDLVKERLHLKDGHIGALNHDADDYFETFADFHKRGFQVATHVQGELAVDRVLDAIEAVLAAHPRADHRHRLEHNALITTAQLQRAAALGVTTSFFIDHLYFYGHALPDLVGDRTARYMPVKAALDAGHKATVHTDSPSSPIGAFRAMQTLRMRTPQQGNSPLAEAQKLTPQEALEAMTINAAWQLGLENETGSLEIGKRADFLIVSQNPLTVEDDLLQETAVIATWLNGQPVDTRTVTPTSIGLGFDVLWGMVFGG